MYVINLCGGPGCGKSTVAVGLFNVMKKKQYNVELVTEYVKDVMYDDNVAIMNDQLLLTAQQNHKLKRLENKVDFVISDASLFNGIVYQNFFNNEKIISQKEAELSLYLFNKYKNIVFLLPRNTDKKYRKIGRLQNEEEAKMIDSIFIEKLTQYGIDFYDFRSYSIDEVECKILKLLNNLFKIEE